MSYIPPILPQRKHLAALPPWALRAVVVVYLLGGLVLVWLMIDMWWGQP